jgi:broad specificity phosphatase PhoE
MGEIILVRHGETEWSAAGRHTGRTDIPLSPEGEARARSVGTSLLELRKNGHRIAAAWSSPAARARRTAELAGIAVDGADPDLWEWDYGGYEGITTTEIQEQRPGWYLWTDGVVPGGPGGFPGETVAEVGERCDRVIARVRPLVDPLSPNRLDGDVALVAHGHYLRVLAARWLSLPPADGALFRLDTAAVSRLGFEHERPVLTEWNDVPS